MSLWHSLRQLVHPRLYRIPQCPLPDDLLARLDELAAELAVVGAAPPASEAPSLHGPAVGTTGPTSSSLADLATGLWRLRGRMVEPGSDRPMEEMRRAFRHFETAWDALATAGIRVQDHTGELFHHGSALKVIAHEPTGGLRRPEVIQTLRPTVYLDDVCVQVGEVIVGGPLETPGPEGAANGGASADNG